MAVANGKILITTIQVNLVQNPMEKDEFSL